MKTLEPNFSVKNIPKNGPCFGRNDLRIADRNGLHQAHLINTFNHPQFSAESNEAKVFMAGFSPFSADEIEVYQLI